MLPELITSLLNQNLQLPGEEQQIMNPEDHILLLIQTQGLTAIAEGAIHQVTIIQNLLPNQHITAIQGRIKTEVTVITLKLPVPGEAAQVTGQVIQLQHGVVQAA